MIIIFTFVAVLILFFVMNEVIIISVFGRLLKKEDLDAYLEKHLSEYEINEYDSRRQLLWSHGKPSIGKLPFSLISCRYISGYGTIPKWSKWHKAINEYRNEMNIKQPKKTLRDEI